MEKNKTIKVATLNYCDIMNNPFQFYCDDFAKQLIEISATFQRILPQYIPKFDKAKFKWDMGKIDQKIRTGRYSPCFALFVGIENDGFLNRKQFEAKWDQHFEKLAKAKELDFTEQQRLTTRLYDLVVFHTLLAFAFKKDDFTELIKNPPNLYLDIYRPFYDLSFLSEEKKMNKLVGNLDKIKADVWFLQQFSWDFMKKMEATNQYHIGYDKGKDKLILARKAIFQTKKNTEEILSKTQIDSLDWTKESPSILICDKFILINIHLSSKEEKNKGQVVELKKSLEKLRTEFPQYHFIVAGDVNSFIKFEHIFNFYPQNDNQITTIKKRTMSQGQYHKGNKLISESKDKIVTTLPIKEGKITYVNLKPASKESLIPTDDHPFDHFLITATLILP